MELWRKNYRAFKNQLPDLLKTNEGQYALVKDLKIVKIFNTEEEADNHATENNFKPNSFLIQEITDRIFRHVIGFNLKRS